MQKIEKNIEHANIQKAWTDGLDWQFQFALKPST